MEHFMNLHPQKQHKGACMVQSFHQNFTVFLFTADRHIF